MLFRQRNGDLSAFPISSTVPLMGSNPLTVETHSHTIKPGLSTVYGHTVEATPICTVQCFLK